MPRIHVPQNESAQPSGRLLALTDCAGFTALLERQEEGRPAVFAGHGYLLIRQSRFDSGRLFYNSASRQMCWRLGPAWCCVAHWRADLPTVHAQPQPIGGGTSANQALTPSWCSASAWDRRAHAPTAAGRRAAAEWPSAW